MPPICWWGMVGCAEGCEWLDAMVGEVDVLIDVQCRCVLEYLVPYMG